MKTNRGLAFGGAVVAIMIVGAIFLSRFNRDQSPRSAKNVPSGRVNRVIPPVPKPSPKLAEVMEHLREAIESQNVAAISELKARLATMEGYTIAHLVDLLLRCNVRADQALLSSLFGDSPPRKSLNAVLDCAALFEVRERPHTELSRAFTALADILGFIAGQENFSKLVITDALRLRLPDASQDELTALALLAVYSRFPQWLAVVESVLSSLEEHVLERLIISEIAATLGKDATRDLMAVYLNPAHSGLRKAIAESLLATLGAEEALPLVLDAAGATGDTLAIVDTYQSVAKVVKDVPDGFFFVESMWGKSSSSITKMAILAGLSSDQGRQDISIFLEKVARDDVDGLIRGNALISMSGRGGVQDLAVVGLANEILTTPRVKKQDGEDDDNVMQAKSASLSALRNLWIRGSYRDHYTKLLSGLLRREDEDPRVLKGAIRTIMEMKTESEFLDSLRALSSGARDPEVKELASEAIKPR